MAGRDGGVAGGVRSDAGGASRPTAVGCGCGPGGVVGATPDTGAGGVAAADGVDGAESAGRVDSADGGSGAAALRCACCGDCGPGRPGEPTGAGVGGASLGVVGSTLRASMLSPTAKGLPSEGEAGGRWGRCLGGGA